MSTNTLVVEFSTNRGNFSIEVYPEQTPKTVENFLSYVKSGFYDNTIFHRVIPGFMVQGGGFDASFTQKPTESPVENEAKLGPKNTIGTISMARTNLPHSATSQFFINVADNEFLDHVQETPDGYGYCAFGKVVDGMDIILKISKTETHSYSGHQDVPCEDIIILKACCKQTNLSEEEAVFN